MTTTSDDPGGATSLDLTGMRIIKATRAQVWAAWADGRHVARWWAPAPWTTEMQAYEFRPGGAIRATMRGPGGEVVAVNACFVDLVENERVVFTDALEAGWRPSRQPFITAIMTMEDHDGATRYTVRALHKDEADVRRHEERGFHDAIGTVIDQLAQVAAGLGRA